ncbi:tyrosine-protein phosphatase [Ferrimonas aestuarii]|uniref:protein-tyrosine-phosphatase n=1 Tax=Ferrimonas aestuarii TaxID=2569539 RepID=A0A4U1BKE0_9GAMM|nr:CpsB/CapC family capsule biosynthesis tyrosine phosphatase [Ferrimonas aestuarii]TKB51979.1 hypothetical protein FCL42_16300 [Ferrimonas aestuarii]
MIDLHSHMLPEVDDGARTLEEALEMAGMAVACGITHMVLTPHINLRHYPNSLESLTPVFEAFQAAVKSRALPLQLALGAEVRIAPELLMGTAWQKLPTIGQLNGKPVLLLEMPYSQVPAGTIELIRWLTQQQVQPVIAHPERNREVMAHLSLAQDLKHAGALLQGTVGAFTGDFGEGAKAAATQLMQGGLFDYLASDSHRQDKRSPQLSTVLAELNRAWGEERMLALTETLPWQIAQSKFA